MLGATPVNRGSGFVGSRLLTILDAAFICSGIASSFYMLIVISCWSACDRFIVPWVASLAVWTLMKSLMWNVDSRFTTPCIIPTSGGTCGPADWPLRTLFYDEDNNPERVLSATGILWRPCTAKDCPAYLSWVRAFLLAIALLIRVCFTNDPGLFSTDLVTVSILVKLLLPTIENVGWTLEDRLLILITKLQ